MSAPTLPEQKWLIPGDPEFGKEELRLHTRGQEILSEALEELAAEKKRESLR